MRVFILCTGRSGSKSFINACQQITNYTSAHESLAKKIGEQRFDYPDMHIEADNRLSWFLGTLESKYKDEPFYVHLTRDKQKTVDSYIKRWNNQGAIVNAFATGILMQGYKKLNQEEKEIIVSDFYDTVTNNINAFLANKSKVLSIQLENITTQFPTFFEQIGAEGNLEAAIESLKKPINTSGQNKLSIIDRIKNRLH